VLWVHRRGEKREIFDQGGGGKKERRSEKLDHDERVNKIVNGIWSRNREKDEERGERRI